MSEDQSQSEVAFSVLSYLHWERRGSVCETRAVISFSYEKLTTALDFRFWCNFLLVIIAGSCIVTTFLGRYLKSWETSLPLSAWIFIKIISLALYQIVLGSCAICDSCMFYSSKSWLLFVVYQVDANSLPILKSCAVDEVLEDYCVLLVLACNKLNWWCPHSSCLIKCRIMQLVRT